MTWPCEYALGWNCIATWYSVLQFGSRESVSQYTKYIVTGEAEGWLGKEVCRNTKGYIVAEGLGCWEFCVAIHCSVL